jgi:hypothetical protein
MILAGKLSCLAMATQYSFRGLIKDYCRRKSLTPSAFFLERVRVAEMDDALAYAFPIYAGEQASLLTRCLTGVERALADDGPDPAIHTAVKEASLLFAMRRSIVARRGANSVLPHAYAPVIGPTVGGPPARPRPASLPVLALDGH